MFDQIATFLQIHLRNFEKRHVDKDISVTLTDMACDYVLMKAYDPSFGARPIARFIEKVIGTELSRLIISEKLPDHSTVTVDAKGDALEYHAEAKDHDMKDNPPKKRRRTDSPPAMKKGFLDGK